MIRAGAGLFALAATICVVVPSPIGGNIGRLEDVAAVPLAVGLLWRRKVIVMAALIFPLVLSQWSPAWGAISSSASAPSTHAAFFAPLDETVSSLAGSARSGRIEVVPTLYHWESVYVAEVMPIARGWERQLDLADNPIFYRSGALTPIGYREWLLDNAVQFVAIAEAPLDEAGVAEAHLVRSGSVPGLVEIWHSGDWQLYRVVGSPGILSGNARLVSISDGSHGSVVVDALGPGAITLRIHFTRDWVLEQGAGCVTSTPGDWTLLDVRRAERLRVTLSITGGGRSRCPAAYDENATGTATPGSAVAAAAMRP